MQFSAWIIWQIRKRVVVSCCWFTFMRHEGAAKLRGCMSCRTNQSHVHEGKNRVSGAISRHNGGPKQGGSCVHVGQKHVQFSDSLRNTSMSLH